MSISMSDVKALREQTGAGVMDAKKALEESGGDMKKAAEWVRQRGLAKAEKKADRETREGLIAHYVHTNGKVAALVEILCETDFVARGEELQSLSKEVAMQVASMNPSDVEDLLSQDFIKDGSQTIRDLVQGLSGKIGEKIMVNRFVRFELGQTA